MLSYGKEERFRCQYGELRILLANQFAWALWHVGQIQEIGIATYEEARPSSASEVQVRLILRIALQDKLPRHRLNKRCKASYAGHELAHQLIRKRGESGAQFGARKHIRYFGENFQAYTQPDDPLFRQGQA